MEWRDEAILLGLRPHGENSAILSLFTAQRGRHAGLVQGAKSKRLRGALQPGNRMAVNWRARLEDHLGAVTVELEEALAARLMDDAGRLAALTSTCAMIDRGLPEREPHPTLYLATLALLHDLAAPDWAAAYVRWETAFLGELGYGLDLSCCASTGVTEGLVYVSPRTGRAVSREAGLPWHDRLLPLPSFLTRGNDIGAEAVGQGLLLTGFFLTRCFAEFTHKPLPDARARLVTRFPRPNWAGYDIEGR